MTPGEYNRAADEFSDRIYRFVLKSMGDPGRAEDVVQDCYEKLWVNVTEIDFSKARSWLFTTAYNRMIDILRREKRVICEEEFSVEVQYSDGYSDLNEVLHRCLEKLPENWRSVILLRDYEGYSYEEIASVTGQTDSQVKINIYRGRLALRSMIGKMEAVV
ncbi:MAG: RNA polymerase sigma factor [Bacteroidales bacterium]|nr:RNA polymerase sigma factor [Bacteroidales bacterium]